MKNHTLVAVDLAKNVFEVAISDSPGRISRRSRLSRTQFPRFCAQLQPATVLLEACGSAHHWARLLLSQGHQVVLLPPHAVRPYVQRNKTDQADAKALLEAYRNEDIRPVPVKSIDQQALAALHRLRSAWVAERTARINTIRGILREFGLTIPVGARHVVPKVHELLDETNSILPGMLRPVLRQACEEIGELERRIRLVERQLQNFVRASELAKRLTSVPGVGLITATALVAFVGNVNRFATGRRFASYLGLTPREWSSGTKRTLGRISKRGDVYLRMLMIHGARAVLATAKKLKQPDPIRAWAMSLQARRGHNKATVALANKLARCVWAVWREEREFVPFPKAA
jgi:transposase